MPNDDGLIGRYLHARDRAAANGDANLVRECDTQLARYGWRPEATPVEVARAEEKAEAAVVPRRGRPPGRRSRS